MERNKGHIDEGTLHAWLDGALPPEESSALEAHIVSCTACGDAAAEARGLVAAASRILTALDDVPGGVAPGGRGAGSRLGAATGRRHRLWTGWPLRAAAAIIFVVAGSLAVVHQMGTGVQHFVAQTPSAVPAPVVAERQSVKKEAVATQKPARKRQAVAADATPPAPEVAPAPAVAQSVAMDSTSTSRPTTSPVTVTGRVVSATTGEPVPQATVRLSNPSNPPVRTVITDSIGGYTLQIPSAEANTQLAQLTVRRIGYESKVDSVSLAQATTPRDTVRRDIALAPSTARLDQVVVSGTGQRAAAAKAAPAPSGVMSAARGLFRKMTPHYPTGCYAMNAKGWPGWIELPSLRIPPPDSARFPGRRLAGDSVPMAIVLTDTASAQYILLFEAGDSVLQGLQAADSTGARPFVAKRIAARCP